MFQLSHKLTIRIEILKDSPLYFIDNFFRHPNEIIKFLFDNPAELWKKDQTPSYNNVYFSDRRHLIKGYEVEILQKELENICNKKIYHRREMYSNVFRFMKNNFNNYKEHYWFPHKDSGYTSIVYLNRYSDDGTNLYFDAEISKCPEHQQPWQPRSKYRLLKKIEAKFNRCVIFDANKFLHGMSIENDRFSTEDRITLVNFFE